MAINKTTAIIVLAGISVGLIFGFMGSNFFELKIIQKGNVVPAPTVTTNSPTTENVIPVTPRVTVPVSDRNKYRFGGIPSSPDQLLPGTHVDEKLTLNNRNRTVAVDDLGNRYYYVDHWGWFNQSEYDALNKFVKDNDLSPYSCDNPDYC